MLTPRPSMGAWITYGLGTENQDLPGFAVVSPPAGSTGNCGNDFLPAVYQATLLRDADRAEGDKIPYLDDPSLPPELRRRELDFLRQVNRAHADRSGHDSRLDSMIESLELAFRMQQGAPEVL